jgi:LysR family transcriptional regulator for metE and metH
MLDLVRRVLAPVGVAPARRTTGLTVAMLQLVASGRGLAALPLWAVKSYLDGCYVSSQRIGARGLTGRIDAAVPEHLRERPCLVEFVRLTRGISPPTLPGVTLLQDP